VSLAALCVGRRSISVAAGLLAATLALRACSDVDQRRAALPQSKRLVGRSDGEPIDLPARWLIPPDPNLDPPLAAPLAIASDEEDGRLLILELQPPELRSYSLATGELLQVMGREGDGPGEYRNPIDLAVNRNGLAAVLSASGRVTFWRRDGTLAGTVEAGPGLATDIMAARADTFYVKSDLFPPDDVSEFRLVAPDTAFADARYRDVDVVPVVEPGLEFRNHAHAVGATQDGDLLLSPWGPRYLILRIGTGGKTRQRIERSEVAPLVRSASEIEAIRERVRKGFAAAGRPSPHFIPVPQYRPHLASLAVASDGSIWGLTQRGDAHRSVLDCYGSDGRYIATYSVKGRISAIAVTPDRLVMLARGDDDIPGVAMAERPGGACLDAEG